jgi:hypothetical protein
LASLPDAAVTDQGLGQRTAGVRCPTAPDARSCRVSTGWWITQSASW